MGAHQESYVHTRPGAPRRAPARSGEAVALRSQTVGGMSRLRRKNQTWGSRLPLLRRHPRPRESRPVWFAARGTRRTPEKPGSAEPSGSGRREVGGTRILCSSAVCCARLFIVNPTNLLENT